MTQLSNYMNSIIQVVNQHAKLLDTVSHELNLRPMKKEVGEMFNILTHGFPYDQVLKDFGMNPNTAVTRPVFITEQMAKKQIKMGQPLNDQLKQPVEDMWDGFDRFCKVQEL